MVGMAFIAAQAMECLPFLYCATWSAWHWAQVSGVGIFTFATSAAEVCSSPWQTTQPISDWLCLLSFQSETMLGVVLVWHSMHCALGEAELAAEAIPGVIIRAATKKASRYARGRKSMEISYEERFMQLRGWSLCDLRHIRQSRYGPDGAETRKLLVPQRLDGIEVGSADGGDHAAHQAGNDEDASGHDHGDGGDDEADIGGLGVQRHFAVERDAAHADGDKVSETDSADAAHGRDDQGFRKKLREDVAL